MNPFPDRELIRQLRSRFLRYGFKTLTQSEAILLINHQHELIAELEKENERLRQWVETTNPWRDERPGSSSTVNE